MVPKAMSRIEQIIDNPEDDKIGLAAAKDLLDRAGHGAVNKNLNINAEVNAGMDIDEQIEQMLVRRAAGEG